MAEEPVERNANPRPQRKPFGSSTQKLAYEGRTGYHRHWFNDIPGRLQQAAEAGYKIIKDKGGKEVARPVGIYDNGVALLAYLMEIPEEWYQEDIAKQQSSLDEMDAAIKRGAFQGAVGKDGRYIPAQGIKMGVSIGR
jgi:hypothetical protein